MKNIPLWQEVGILPSSVNVFISSFHMCKTVCMIGSTLKGWRLRVWATCSSTGLSSWGKSFSIYPGTPLFFSTYFYSSLTTVWIFDVCFFKSTSLPLIQISIEDVWWLGTWRITAYLHIVIAISVIPLPFKFLCSTLFIKHKWVIYLCPGTLIIWSGDLVKMYSIPTNYWNP